MSSTRVRRRLAVSLMAGLFKGAAAFLIFCYFLYPSLLVLLPGIFSIWYFAGALARLAPFYIWVVLVVGSWYLFFGEKQIELLKNPSKTIKIIAKILR